ncbi:MAG: guanylate kinase [Paracoccaceae bacterium]|nr:guanylate kinase [Paracoccaceae bacterium]
MDSNLLYSEGILFIISSPSGAGKTSASRRILNDDPNVTFSISATTRMPREGEKEGREYFFKTNSEFENMVQAGEMLEYADVFGNKYGTPKTPVENAIANGRDVLFDVDWQGGIKIRNSHLRKFVVSIFILPPSIQELENRLVLRGQDSAGVVKSRMMKAKEEISHWSEYDYILVNKNIELVHQDIKSIIRTERLRRVNRQVLVEFVNSLNYEFEERYT